MNVHHSPRRMALAALLGLQLLLAGCATGMDPRDPWEPFNRRVASFNDVLDDNLLQPVAKGYQTVFPDVVRTGVGNFFGNLSDAWSAVNNLLQFKPREAAQSVARFGINTTVGILGLVDVASGLEIPRQRQDFGQTLGHWGVGTGPYVVLPLLGPSTLRDTAALPVDWKGDLVRNTEGSVQNSLMTLRIVDKRATLLGASNVLDTAVLDRYTFLREAYLQRRGGAPAPASEPEERYDLPEGAQPSANPAQEPALTK